MSLRDRLTSGSFAVTAEISPPRGASTDPITATAALLRDWVTRSTSPTTRAPTSGWPAGPAASPCCKPGSSRSCR